MKISMKWFMADIEKCDMGTYSISKKPYFSTDNATWPYKCKGTLYQALWQLEESISKRKIQTSRISSVGICGRKSFPTKKQMKMKSSIKRSKLFFDRWLGICMSCSKYSRSIHILTNCQKVKVLNDSGKDINEPFTYHAI